jgi:hypothetical protein
MSKEEGFICMLYISIYRKGYEWISTQRPVDVTKMTTRGYAIRVSSEMHAWADLQTCTR